MREVRVIFSQLGEGGLNSGAQEIYSPESACAHVGRLDQKNQQVV